MQAPVAAPAPAAAVPAARCENCETPIAGKYCSECGQRYDGGHPVHSVRHFVREATEDLTHADSRLWQTLIALLARPGLLTREFLDGRRARYLPPLRLYLVLSLVFFLLSGLQQPEQGSAFSVTTGPRQAREQMTPERAREICPELVQSARNLWSAFGNQEKPLTATCLKMGATGGAAFQEAVLHNVERAMFVFLPVLALFPTLLYWRPRRYYVEHLLFFVHNHAFLFLIFSLHLIVKPIPIVGDLVDLAAWAYIPWYLYRSMRRVYGQRRVPTLLKFGAFLGVYILTAIVTLVGTIVYSVLTL